MTAERIQTVQTDPLLRVQSHPRSVKRRAHVCVVVPVYNYAHYVEASLRSVLDQEGVDVSLIVLDDKSTDESLAVVTRMAADDPRIRVVANEQNMGHVPTVNRGMALVDAEYVVKLDSDDLLTPGSLARSAALLDTYPAAGFVYGFPLSFSTPQPPVARTRVRSWTVWPGRQWIELGCRGGPNRIWQPEAMMRTSVLRQAGEYRESLPYSSDFEMWFRLAAIADVGRVNGPHQGCYRQHGASMSHTLSGGTLRDIAERLRGFDSFFESSPLSDTKRLQEIAHRSLAKEAMGFAISYHARGVAAAEPIDDYERFVVATWPEARSTRQWRALQRVRTMSEAQCRSDPAVILREFRRNMALKLTWRRWRRSGV